MHAKIQEILDWLVPRYPAPTDSLSEVIADCAKEGFSPSLIIVAMDLHFGVPHSQAKKMVSSHPVWGEKREEWRKFHQELEKAIDTSGSPWKELTQLVRELKVNIRVKLLTEDLASDWSSWLGEPSPDYIELASVGPVKKTEVAWVEFRARFVRKLGKHARSEQMDFVPEIIARLSGVEGVSWKLDEVEGIVRIALDEQASWSKPQDDQNRAS